MESKEGDLGGLVAQTGKLTEELHAQEKICSDLRTEVLTNPLLPFFFFYYYFSLFVENCLQLRNATAGRHDVESQNKQLTEKLMEMEAVSAHLNTELTQQLAHLRAESDHKSKTISNLESNMEIISSHLSQTRLQLDELAKTSGEKSETIAHLQTQVSALELQQEKDKVDLQALAKLGQDRADSIAELNADLARKSAELHALERSVSEKSDAVLDLERKFADSQKEIECTKQETAHFSHQLEQRTIDLNDQKAKTQEMAAAHEEEHLRTQRISGEIREKLANVEVQLASVSNELDNEKRERVADEEKHKVTINSLVIMIEGTLPPPPLSSPPLSRGYSLY
jgi:chromosome segregation ATPase